MNNPNTPGIQTGRQIWYGPEIVTRENEWLFTLNSLELDELKINADVLASVDSKDENSLSLELLDAFENNFCLPNIQAKVNIFTEELHNGLGFVVWRGIPVDEWSQRQLAAAFLIIGKCFGNLRQQNIKGHVLGHVRDTGLSSSAPNVRLHQTLERQSFHTDSCDVVGLLFLKIAKSGGHSSLMSSGTLYNELFTSDPDFAAALELPISRDKRGQVTEGTSPYYNIPVFNHHDGYLTTTYHRQYINSAQRFPDAPRLTQTQITALDKFDSLANDPRLNFTMQLLPGDMQFVHNHTILHDRTGFVDWPELERKRHLLRVWIATPGARSLPQVFEERFGSVTVGDRGGVCKSAVASVAPLTL